MVKANDMVRPGSRGGERTAIMQGSALYSKPLLHGRLRIFFNQIVNFFLPAWGIGACVLFLQVPWSFAATLAS